MYWSLDVKGWYTFPISFCFSWYFLICDHHIFFEQHQSVLWQWLLSGVEYSNTWFRWHPRDCQATGRNFYWLSGKTACLCSQMSKMGCYSLPWLLTSYRSLIECNFSARMIVLCVISRCVLWWFYRALGWKWKRFQLNQGRYIYIQINFRKISVGRKRYQIEFEPQPHLINSSVVQHQAEEFSSASVNRTFFNKSRIADWFCIVFRLKQWLCGEMVWDS